jgi:autotransporter-associated beta strand protein
LEKIMKKVVRLAGTLAIFASLTHFANADTFYYNNAGAAAAQDWENPAIWNPDAGNTSGRTFPNAEGEVVIFNSLATANNPAQTLNHTVNLNTTTTVTDKTVGAIISNLDATTGLTARNNIQTSTGGTLILDGAGATNATIDHYNSATAMGLTNFNLPMQLNDQLQLNIHNVSNRPDGLSLRLQGSISGAGGLTRLGVASSLLTMVPLTGNSYTYTGPTILDGGRTQIQPGSLTASSSFTVQNTAQLEPAVDGTYQLGAANAPLYLNSDGTGNLGGQGTIRPVRLGSPLNRPAQITITNTSVVLQAPVTVIHSEGFAVNGTDPSLGFIQLDGVVSGGATNKLQFTTTGHSQNHGTYVLTNTNTYSGGTDVMAGRLSTDFLSDGGVFNSSTLTAHPNANFGAGDVHVVASPSNVAFAVSRVTIPSGVLNAIGNAATLSIDGNADWGRSAFAELGDGIDEVVGKLVLGGTTQLSGVTYGSTAATGAMFQSDTYFTGTGMVQVGALGDFNGNGTVDAADYVLWRKSYSGNTALYDLWATHFGNTAPGSGSGGGLGASAVPEPSTFVLIALTMAPLLINQRRRVA